MTRPPREIAEQILDLAKWTDFRGYGPIPGIKAVHFETRTANVIGSRIRVTNDDGSSHVEEIVEWDPDRRVQLRMREFSRPLCWLASGFIETWEFGNDGTSTNVSRSMAIYPRSMVSKPLLWLISKLLKRAIDHHLDDIQKASK